MTVKMDIADIINGIHRLPPDSYSRFLKLVSVRKYPKGHHLYRESTRATRIYFIKEGIVRAYSTRGGKEITAPYSGCKDNGRNIKTAIYGTNTTHEPFIF